VRSDGEYGASRNAERFLLEASLLKPDTNFGREVGGQSISRPDHESRSRAQGGEGVNHALDVTAGDVSKDAAAEDDIGRGRSSVGVGHPSIRLNNLDVS
jgi:hypothetical protein